MSYHRKIETTLEVWTAIRLAHPQMVVFASYSAPDGDDFGDPNECVMKTEYGFSEGDFPVMGAETRWDKDHENSSNRLNERHQYWLCVGIIES